VLGLYSHEASVQAEEVERGQVRIVARASTDTIRGTWRLSNISVCRLTRAVYPESLGCLTSPVSPCLLFPVVAPLHALDVVIAEASSCPDYHNSSPGEAGIKCLDSDRADITRPASKIVLTASLGRGYATLAQESLVALLSMKER
jgi:hypothetical protein